MDNKSFALLAAKTLDNKKAIDIVVIDIAEKSSFADYMVIASGGSERQVQGSGRTTWKMPSPRKGFWSRA